MLQNTAGARKSFHNHAILPPQIMHERHMRPARRSRYPFRHSRAGGNPETTSRAILGLDSRLRGNDVVWQDYREVHGESARMDAFQESAGAHTSQCIRGGTFVRLGSPWK